MSQTKPDKCFVVMPFGEKPIGDGTGLTYDFDKVYRVIMCRAIRQAGLEPIRADERKGANIIHTDMFKDLRDQKVVLADLSLLNPNVFYELGIRHVMSPRGTVLMCRYGSELPFDVKLSRVIFYKFDGENLDWEEVERVVKELQYALEEAQRGVLDSPVYALLERVLREQDATAERDDRLGEHGTAPGEPLDRYQRLVADHWGCQEKKIGELLEEFGRSEFGARSLGHLCLRMQPLPPETEEVADKLYWLEEYDLARDLYEKLEAAGALDSRGLLRYASAISEDNRTLHGVQQASGYIERALQATLKRVEVDSPEPEAISDAAWCYHARSGMLLWKWELSRSPDDLRQAIELLELAREYTEKAIKVDPSFAVGRVAQVHLRLLLLLREQDQNMHRADVEGHREAILGIKPAKSHRPKDVSYLRWYQAITLADAGDGEGSRRMALRAYSEDAKIVGGQESFDIGRGQYTHLRRFMEHHSHVLRHPELIGHISQLLLIGQSAHGYSVPEVAHRSRV